MSANKTTIRHKAGWRWHGSFFGGLGIMILNLDKNVSVSKMGNMKNEVYGKERGSGL